VTLSRSPWRAAPIFPFSSSEINPSSVVTKHIRVGNETLAAQKGGDKPTYHNDHLGSVNFHHGHPRRAGLCRTFVG
jgi:hypothetical protein